MLEKLNKIYKYLTEKGIPMPLGYDPVSKKPSITITFAHFTFTIAVFAVFRYLNNMCNIMQVLVCIMFWSMSTVFYLIRQINKAKFNLQQQSFEFEGGDGNQNNNKRSYEPQYAPMASIKADDPDA
jgi:hypothetical protein